MTTDAPMHALDAASPAGLSPEEKLVWILGDLMFAAENFYGAANPKRLGHINSAAIRIIDEVLAPAEAERDRLREALVEGLDILTNLHDSIAKHGNYSAEATMCFVDQAGACLREALAKEAGK